MNKQYLFSTFLVFFYFSNSCNKNSNSTDNNNSILSRVKSQPIPIVQCHNCYQTGSTKPNSTIQLIDKALKKGAQIIELDLFKNQNQDPVVKHHETETGPLLSEVMKYEILNERRLHIEIKDSEADKNYLKKVIKLITEKSSSDINHIISTFEENSITYNNLKEVLKEHNKHRKTYLITLTHGNTSDQEYDALVNKVKNQGVPGGIGFNIKTTKNLSRRGKKAKNQGLLVNLWTLRSCKELSYQGNIIESLWEYVDILTVEEGCGQNKPTNILVTRNKLNIIANKPDMFLIKNVKNNLCLDVKGYEAKPRDNVMLYYCDNYSDQKWYLDGKMIRNAHSGLCLDVKGYDGKSRDNVMLYECDHFPDQEWLIENDLIKNQKKGLCLDVKGYDGELKNNVMLYRCDHFPDQEWYMVPVINNAINQ